MNYSIHCKQLLIYPNLLKLTDKGVNKMAQKNKWDQLFKEISDIKYQNTKIEAKLDSSIHRLEQKLENLTQYVNQQLEFAKQKTSLVEIKLQTETEKFKTFEKKYVKDQILSDLHSKRNNLIIYGLPERDQNEWRDKSRQLVKNFLKDQLKIDQDIAVVDAHRLRPRETNDGKPIKSRPLLFKLSYDKDLIMSNLLYEKFKQARRDKNEPDGQMTIQQPNTACTLTK